MNRFELEATGNSPYVNIDAENGLIELKGSSYPEDPVGYYENILDWITDNFNKLSQKIEVNIKLEYFNTSTSKSLFKLFQLLGKKKKVNNNDVIINWFFRVEDEDMLEAGEAYKGLSQLPFHFVEV